MRNDHDDHDDNPLADINIDIDHDPGMADLASQLALAEQATPPRRVDNGLDHGAGQ